MFSGFPKQTFSLLHHLWLTLHLHRYGARPHRGLSLSREHDGLAFYSNCVVFFFTKKFHFLLGNACHWLLRCTKTEFASGFIRSQLKLSFALLIDLWIFSLQVLVDLLPPQIACVLLLLNFRLTFLGDSFRGRFYFVCYVDVPILSFDCTDQITNSLYFVIVLFLFSEVPNFVLVCFVLEVLPIVGGHTLPCVSHFFHDIQRPHFWICAHYLGPRLNSKLLEFEKTVILPPSRKSYTQIGTSWAFLEWRYGFQEFFIHVRIFPYLDLSYTF